MSENLKVNWQMEMARAMGVPKYHGNELKKSDEAPRKPPKRIDPFPHRPKGKKNIIIKLKDVQISESFHEALKKKEQNEPLWFIDILRSSEDRINIGDCLVHKDSKVIKNRWKGCMACRIIAGTYTRAVRFNALGGSSINAQIRAEEGWSDFLPTRRKIKIRKTLGERVEGIENPRRKRRDGRRIKTTR